MNQFEKLREQCAKIAENIVPRLSDNDIGLKARDVWFLLSRLKANIAEDIRAITLPESPGVPQSIIEENKTLRTMLCLTGSALPYMDDGEMQDNSVNPCIDYKRDSPEEIKSKLNKRDENANPTVGISLQDEYNTLKAQLEGAIAALRDKDDLYLKIEELNNEVIATQLNKIKKLRKENARLQELANTKKDANSFLQKGISLPCDMSEREKFEAVMRSDDSPLNNEVPFDSEIMEAAWFSWNAAIAAKALPTQLSSNPLQLPTQAPVAYRVIASVNGDVVRDSLEFTRMSEIDEKVVRNSYDLEIIPLYSARKQEPERVKMIPAPPEKE